MFFSEEKNQKTFASCAGGTIRGPAPNRDVDSQEYLLYRFRQTWSAA
jgi:hypothetical protein